jgi:hypothetical protein
MTGRKAAGRPSHHPTAEDRRMVEVLRGFGIPLEGICHSVGITKPTLLKHYAQELDVGAAKLEANLIGKLMRLSQGSDGTALKATMFMLCCRFGWSRYAPRLEAPGKKEQADIDAQTAHETSDWGSLVH